MTESTTERVPILYVGGMPRSGSTLTGLLFDQLPGHIGVGEIFYLWDDALVRNSPCACGETFHACSFWQAVGERAYDGWESIDPERVKQLQRTVDVTAAIPKLVRKPRSAAFASSLNEYLDLLTRLYRAVVAVSGCRIVVDSSKRPSMAYALRHAAAIDLKVAHVVRDPRGVAYSFSKTVTVDRGLGVPKEMPRAVPRKVARRWVTVNLSIAGLSRFGVPLERLRYEDLVAQPQRELSRVLDLEQQPLPVDWSFVENGAVNIPRTHAIAAGRVSQERGSMPLRRDDAWRQALPERDRRLVSTLTAPLRLWYGY